MEWREGGDVHSLRPSLLLAQSFYRQTSPPLALDWHLLPGKPTLTESGSDFFLFKF
jgi:hypothetical protein